LSRVSDNLDRFVLAIDEAQWLRLLKGHGKMDMALVLAYVYDNLSNVKVILTGSEVGLLHDFIGFNDVRSPLYGRIMDELTLEPFSRGQKPDLLKVERVVLNVLMRASGIATMTRRILERARSVNPRVRVAATRKTTPFLRYLEKKAVAIGGGDPHRFSLSDAVLIKDNHIRAVGGLEKAIMLARERSPFTVKIEVEVETVEDAIKAAELGVDIIMLDNMKPSDVAKVHEELVRRGLRDRVVLEASGGINEDNVIEYARYVDVVSMGALTHSYKSIDMSMDLIK
jgi:nicotinate-nucleotide pyrophosphorylase (carboxylating)